MRFLTPLAFATAAVLSGCATVSNPVPDDYTGPTAQLNDTVSMDQNERDQIFAVLEFDGARIKNALSETRRASAGKGFWATTLSTSRPIPARKSRLKLLGTHFSAAPIAEIARRAAGTFQSTEGEVEFTPEAGKTYEVLGELTKQLSCVWISDASTKQIVSSKVCSK